MSICCCCRGIINGIDAEEWKPHTDKHLPPEARYCHTTVTAGKTAAKALFQQRYGLDIDPEVPLIGMVGRLAPQKGFDVVLAALPALLAPAGAAAARMQEKAGLAVQNPTAGALKPQRSGCQLALLGSGWLSGYSVHVQSLSVSCHVCAAMKLLLGCYVMLCMTVMLSL